MIACSLLLVAAAATSPPPEDPAIRAYGLDAPLLAVDRFSDAAGTLLRRSSDRRLPGPNQAIDLDREPFVRQVIAPDGTRLRCYDLDVRPARPGRFYVFYDRIGNYQLGQLPVIDRAPGDPGYSDLWDIWKVLVPDGFRATNTIRDVAAVEALLADPASGYRAERTGALLNGPVVPEGSRAREKAELRGGPATLQYAWYRGKRAPFLYFEELLRIDGDDAPVSSMSGGSPAHIAAAPGTSGYSPLHRTEQGIVNCPVVP